MDTTVEMEVHTTQQATENLSIRINGIICKELDFLQLEEI